MPDIKFYSTGYSDNPLVQIKSILCKAYGIQINMLEKMTNELKYQSYRKKQQLILSLSALNVGL